MSFNIDFGVITNNITNFFMSLFTSHIMPIALNTVKIGIIWIIIAAIFILYKPYFRNYGKLILISIILSMIIGFEIIKPIATHFRYFIIDNNIGMMVPEINSYDFPSVSIMMAVSSVMIIFYMSRKYGLYALGVAGIILFANLHFVVTYPIDVLIGAVIGFIMGFIMILIYKKRYEPFEDYL